jgi:hypothetical protein
MTRTKLRKSLIESAAQIAEREACRVCVAAETQVLGHTECWRLVRIAREIRKLRENNVNKETL